MTDPKLLLNSVRAMINDGIITQEVAEKYFPEITESEDEKIRKFVMTELESAVASLDPTIVPEVGEKRKVQLNMALDYIKKCSPQPIFRVGDKVKWMGSELEVVEVGEYDYKIGDYMLPISRQGELKFIDDGHFRPTKEQLKTLKNIITMYGGEEQWPTLYSLYEELLKL